MLPTRDGAELLTVVFRPCGVARATILHRTPYNARTATLALLATHLVEHGFAVVLQDCRGRYGSTGVQDFEHEGVDGEDTLNWLAAQPWWGDRLGLMGICYSALAMAATVRRCPTAPYFSFISLAGSADLYSFFYPSPGVVALHWYLPFHYLLDGSTQKVPETGVDWNALFRKYPESVEALQVSDFMQTASRWTRVHKYYDDKWSQYDERSSRIADIPTLFVTGLYDLWRNGTIREYERVVKCSSPSRHRLILGSWDHRSLLQDLARFRRCEAGKFLVDELTSWLNHCLTAEPSTGGAVVFPFFPETGATSRQVV